MTSKTAARKSLIVILLMTAVAGLWITLVPFAASTSSESVWCRSPLDSMRDPGGIRYSVDDGFGYSEREACIPGARNRVSTGVMLLVVAGVGGVLTLKLLGDNPIDYVPDRPKVSESAGSH